MNLTGDFVVGTAIPCIAEFVVQFISSDILGMIAMTHLVIADYTEENIFHPDCLKLAQLHSDAVDYPKTGMPGTSADRSTCCLIIR